MITICGVRWLDRKRNDKLGEMSSNGESRPRNAKMVYEHLWGMNEGEKDRLEVKFINKF